MTGPAETSTFTTGPDGQFRFLNVAPGTYQITASLSGFARLVRENIAVTVGQTVTLPVTMTVASVQEEVTVSGGGHGRSSAKREAAETSSMSGPDAPMQVMQPYPVRWKPSCSRCGVRPASSR